MGSLVLFAGALELTLGCSGKLGDTWEDPDKDKELGAPVDPNARLDNPRASGSGGGGGGGGFANIFGGSGGGSSKPAEDPNAFKVNINPSHVAAAGNFAANNASTVATVANAAANSSAASNASSSAPNPFFGNSHLSSSGK